MGIGRRLNLTGRPSTRAKTSAAWRIVSSLPAISSSDPAKSWSVERERDEFSNVVRGDRLVRPVRVKSTGRGEHLVDRPGDRLTHAQIAGHRLSFKMGL